MEYIIKERGRMYSSLSRYVKQEQFKVGGFEGADTLTMYKDYALTIYKKAKANNADEKLNNIYKYYLEATHTSDTNFATVAFLLMLKADSIPSVSKKLGIDQTVALIAYKYKRYYKLYESMPKHKKGYPRTIKGAPAPLCEARQFLDHCYIVYANGMVYSRKSSGYLTGKWVQGKGQLFHLSGDDNKVDYFFSAGELVAAAFLPNPKGYKLVSYKDNNQANADVSNLSYRAGGDPKNHKAVPFKFYE